MNQSRRKVLSEALKHLEAVYNLVDMVSSDELDSLENIPENLQGSELYDKLEESSNSLQEAVEKIDGAMSDIDAAMSV